VPEAVPPREEQPAGALMDVLTRTDAETVPPEKD
jgi:hypothetical protein